MPKVTPDNETVKLIAKYLKVKSKWQHTNGNIYHIVQLTNLKSELPNYVPTVVYRGENGNIWSRPIHDWYRSMRRAPCSPTSQTQEA